MTAPDPDLLPLDRVLMSTAGDPLTDLRMLLFYWVEPGEAADPLGVDGPDAVHRRSVAREELQRAGSTRRHA
jgi:aminoglycoside phosphotransferase (APT) family kinase protein